MGFEFILVFPDLCCSEQIGYFVCMYCIELIAALLELSIGVYIGSTINNERTFVIVMMLALSIIMCCVWGVLVDTNLSMLSAVTEHILKFDVGFVRG